MILLDFMLQIFVYIFSIYLCIVYALIFLAHCFNLRCRIDVVVIGIWSIVIFINSVLNLQVWTASLPHDREPCEIKVVSNHTCSLHTCVCAGSHRVHVHLSGFRRQGISSTPGGFLKCPIPVLGTEVEFIPWNRFRASWAKTRTRNRRVLLSPRSTALRKTKKT